MNHFFLALIPAFLLSAQDTNDCCPESPRSNQIKMKHLEYQGIGFNQGYSSFELFLSNAEPWYCSNYLFLDLRAHVFNDGKPAFNGGFGWRYLFESLQAIGANAYYDYRLTKHKNYNQIGFGLEYLSPRWEARANAYFPLAETVSSLYDLQFSHFAGNEFFISRKHEFAMTGADGEIGWHFMQKGWIDLYVGAGPYYFKGHLGKAAIGGKARIEARISPYFSLEIGDSYDQVFHNRFHAEAAISIPFGPKARTSGDFCCDDYISLQKWLHEPPHRNEPVVLDTQTETSVAIDPGNGLPFFLLFVNNTSSSNGTIESPYPTLLLAESNSSPGNVIYVFPGDGTTTGMDNGFILKDNQRLLGSGVSHLFQTTLGSVTIPPMTSLSPTVTSGGGIIFLANNNEVSGFTLQGGLSAIFANFTGVTTSANINRNSMIDNGINAINITVTTSQSSIFIDNNYIANTLFEGILIPYTMGSSGSILIANNTIENTASEAIRMVHDTGSVVNIAIDSNTTLNNGVTANTNNIFIDAVGLNTTVHTSLTENTIDIAQNSMVTPSGIFLLTDGDATHISQISKNIIRSGASFGSNNLFGIRVETGPLSTANSYTSTVIENNRIIRTGVGILLQSAGSGGFGSVQSAVIRGNTFTQCTGIDVLSAPFTSVNGDIYSNHFEFSYGDGIFANTNTGTLTLNIFENTFNDLTGFGLNIRCEAFGEFNITNNKFTNLGLFTSGTTGVQIDCLNGSNCRAIVENNQFQNNRYGDFLAGMLTSGGGNLCIRLNGNQSVDDLVLQNNQVVPGTIDLEPPVGNSAKVIFDGSVTIVPIGTCN